MTVPCPICRKPCEWEGSSFRPFCSERCRLLDLNGWLSEQYRVPTEDVTMEDDGSPTESNPTETNGQP